MSRFAVLQYSKHFFPLKTANLIDKCCVWSDCSINSPSPLCMPPNLWDTQYWNQAYNDLEVFLSLSERTVDQCSKFHCSFKKLPQPPQPSATITQTVRAINTEAGPSISKAIMVCWKLRWRWAYFSNKVLLKLIKVHISFFRHYAIGHLTDHSTV